MADTRLREFTELRKAGLSALDAAVEVLSMERVIGLAHGAGLTDTDIGEIIELAARPHYNPHEPRDVRGRWSHGAGSAGSAKVLRRSAAARGRPGATAGGEHAAALEQEKPSLKVVAKLATQHQLYTDAEVGRAISEVRTLEARLKKEEDQRRKRVIVVRMIFIVAGVIVAAVLSGGNPALMLAGGLAALPEAIREGIEFKKGLS